MRTKVVYVLVSGESDCYLEQMALSLYSLRHHNPGVKVEIVADQETASRIGDETGLIPEDVIVIAVDVPLVFSKMQRSRWLKTRLRQYIEGSFLYLDTDTLVCGRLDEVDAFVPDIAMVADLNGKLLLSSQATINICLKAGFNGLKDAPYYNSGVIFSNPTQSCYRFFDAWHARWIQSVSKGISFDQPALCMANVDSGFIIKEMSGVWNCQIDSKSSRQFAPDAKIIHFLLKTGRETIPEYIKRNGINDAVKAFVEGDKQSIIAVLSMQEVHFAKYVVSDLSQVYENYPNYYLLISRMAKILLKPYVWFSRIKQSVRFKR